VEPAEEAEGLVRREVTQLLTPGTLLQESLLPREANYLAAIATGDGWGLAFLDVSTGEFKGTVLKSKSALYDELFRHRPPRSSWPRSFWRTGLFWKSSGSAFPSCSPRPPLSRKGKAPWPCGGPGGPFWPTPKGPKEGP
jgi:DNA mismatch repair protein MutS